MANDTQPCGRHGVEMIHVLVVDDNEAVKWMIAVSLASVGAVVTGAGDGIEAWEVLESAPPQAIHLIVCDLQMPRCDGRQFLKRKATSAYRKIPVVVFSGEPDPHDVQEYCDLIISKQQEPKEALGALIRFLEKIKGGIKCEI